MSAHGLLIGAPDRSVETLRQWCQDHGVQISRGIEIRTGPDGWAVFAKRDYELGQILCQVPKKALLSMRTSSLPKLLPDENLEPRSSHTILYLALALLHELRLADESPFWGYLQSLPRQTILLPAFWSVEDLAGEDGREGLEILRGTEAERDILHKNSEGLSLDDVRQFYYALAPHLPRTTLHPEPSPFLAFLHAYSLICTRAFLIDLYHTIALCPFADLFNHSSTEAHTSLSADDFVCYICGSLKECEHDIPSTTGIVRRLEHLPDLERRRLAREEDTVDLRIDRQEVKAGEEVFNSYGENMGDGRLLVEWGFVEADSVGGNITFSPEELAMVTERWAQLLEDGLPNIELDDQEDRLVGPAPEDRPWSLALDTEGAICVTVIIVLTHSASSQSTPASLSDLHGVVKEIEQLNAVQSAGENAPVDPMTVHVIKGVVNLLSTRLAALFRPDLSIDQLFDLRDSLKAGDHLQRMAFSVLLNERRLLESTHEKWTELLSAVHSRVV